ncbi:MAG: hypothetical protein EOO61_21580 [Hymenobacter sp.]|nr:MAG: hypothetical protein EOO61_21580 [Hymenobacter sp.]
MADEGIIYIKVAGLGTLMSDNLLGYNFNSNTYHKMALYNGKYWVVESKERHGPWTLKNGDNNPINPTRIVNYTKEDITVDA